MRYLTFAFLSCLAASPALCAPAREQGRTSLPAEGKHLSAHPRKSPANKAAELKLLYQPGSITPIELGLPLLLLALAAALPGWFKDKDASPNKKMAVSITMLGLGLIGLLAFAKVIKTLQSAHDGYIVGKEKELQLLSSLYQQRSWLERRKDDINIIQPVPPHNPVRYTDIESVSFTKNGKILLQCGPGESYLIDPDCLEPNKATALLDWLKSKGVKIVEA